MRYWVGAGRLLNQFLFTISVLLSIDPAIAATINVALEVTNPTNTTRNGDVVIASVPFGQGALFDLNSCVLLQSGSPLPSQKRILAKWLSDGSVRVGLFKFKQSISPNGQAPTITVSCNSGLSEPTPSTSISITQNDSATFSLNTGGTPSSSFSIDKNNPTKIFSSIIHNGVEIIDSIQQSGFSATGLTGAYVPSNAARFFEIIESGWLRTSVRFGDKFIRSGEEDLYVVFLLEFTAGSSEASIDTILVNKAPYGSSAVDGINSGPHPLHLKDAAIRFSTTLGGSLNGVVGPQEFNLISSPQGIAIRREPIKGEWAFNNTYQLSLGILPQINDQTACNQEDNFISVRNIQGVTSTSRENFEEFVGFRQLGGRYFLGAVEEQWQTAPLDLYSTQQITGTLHLDLLPNRNTLTGQLNYPPTYVPEYLPFGGNDYDPPEPYDPTNSAHVSAWTQAFDQNSYSLTDPNHMNPDGSYVLLGGEMVTKRSRVDIGEGYSYALRKEALRNWRDPLYARIIDPTYLFSARRAYGYELTTEGDALANLPSYLQGTVQRAFEFLRVRTDPTAAYVDPANPTGALNTLLDVQKQGGEFCHQQPLRGYKYNYNSIGDPLSWSVGGNPVAASPLTLSDNFHVNMKYARGVARFQATTGSRWVANSKVEGTLFGEKGIHGSVNSNLQSTHKFEGDVLKVFLQTGDWLLWRQITRAGQSVSLVSVPVVLEDWGQVRGDGRSIEILTAASIVNSYVNPSLSATFGSKIAARIYGLYQAALASQTERNCPAGLIRNHLDSNAQYQTLPNGTVRKDCYYGPWLLAIAFRHIANALIEGILLDTNITNWIQTAGRSLTYSLKIRGDGGLLVCYRSGSKPSLNGFTESINGINIPQPADNSGIVPDINGDCFYNEDNPGRLNLGDMGAALALIGLYTGDTDLIRISALILNQISYYAFTSLGRTLNLSNQMINAHAITVTESGSYSGVVAKFNQHIAGSMIEMIGTLRSAYQQGLLPTNLNLNITPAPGAGYAPIPTPISTPNPSPTGSSGTTPTPVPALLLQPTGLVISSISTNFVTISWTDNSTGELGYDIYRSSSPNSGFTPFAITGPNGFSYTDFNLQPSTTYYYRVGAFGVTSDSPLSTVLSITTLSTALMTPSPTPSSSTNNNPNSNATPSPTMTPTSSPTDSSSGQSCNETIRLQDQGVLKFGPNGKILAYDDSQIGTYNSISNVKSLVFNKPNKATIRMSRSNITEVGPKSLKITTKMATMPVAKSLLANVSKLLILTQKINISIKAGTYAILSDGSVVRIKATKKNTIKVKPISGATANLCS